jgi:hypothetical protein
VYVYVFVCMCVCVYVCVCMCSIWCIIVSVIVIQEHGIPAEQATGRCDIIIGVLSVVSLYNCVYYYDT